MNDTLINVDPKVICENINKDGCKDVTDDIAKDKDMLAVKN